MKPFRKVDVSSIVKENFQTYGSYRNPKDKRAKLADYATMVALPLAVAFAIFFSNFRITDTSILLSAVALIAGLLFNLLILVLDLAFKMRLKANENQGSMSLSADTIKKRMELLRQLRANVSYCILLSVSLGVVLAIPALNITRYHTGLMTPFVVFLAGHFLLSLLMVLKRVRAAIALELNERL